MLLQLKIITDIWAFICFLFYLNRISWSVDSLSLLVAWLSNKVSKVAQSCPTLCDPMDGSLSGSMIHGIFQTRILEWAAISFYRGSSQSRDRTQVSCIADRCFTISATRIPACAWFNPTFSLAYSVYKLNKQGNNIQAWRTPFPIWNQSVVPCPVLTIASC